MAEQLRQARPDQVPARSQWRVPRPGDPELANAIFEYLAIWHNRKRRHSPLGWLTPKFEPNRITIVA